MKFITAVFLSLTLAPTLSVASPSKPEHVGDLICNIGDAPAESAITCLFRNKSTGLEEHYDGRVANAEVARLSGKRTLLWTVNAKPTVDLKAGVLAQRYEAPASEQQRAKTIEGDEKPGVSLSLITDKNEDLSALSTLTIELKLSSAPT
jgi:hypothetical protein